MTLRSGLLTFRGSNAAIRLEEEVFTLEKLFGKKFGSYEGRAVGIADDAFGANCGCITASGKMC